MSGRYFVDTNVFVYALDQSVPAKSQIARRIIGRLLDENAGVISPQVMHEFFAVALRKFKDVLTVQDARAFLETAFAGMEIQPSSIRVADTALRLLERYGFHWYDSLILAAALEAQCDILYSEDFQHKQRIEGVEIINPFA